MQFESFKEVLVVNTITHQENTCKSLQKVVNNYIAKFQFCNKNYPWSIKEYPNIQYYKPKAGYKYWHCERFNSESPVTYRHLVYMTYLNDVTDQGGTEFYYQNMIIQMNR